MTIQERIDKLKPYFNGFRYVESRIVVDALLKPTWIVPKSEVVDFEQNKKQPTHFMLFPIVDEMGLDEMLDYLEAVINANLEREEKTILLQVKIDELKGLFSKHSLSELKNLNFNMVSDDNTIIDDELELKDFKPKISTPKTQPIARDDEKVDSPINENKGMVDDKQGVFTSEKIDGALHLPAKGSKIELEDYSLPSDITEGDCDCPDDKACPKCIDKKGY